MMQHGFLRHGVMVAFESFEHFRTNYEEVISLFRDDCDDSDDEKSYENDGSFNFRNLVRNFFKNNKTLYSHDPITGHPITLYSGDLNIIFKWLNHARSSNGL